MNIPINILHTRTEVAEALQFCLNYEACENVSVCNNASELPDVKNSINLIDTDHVINFISTLTGDVQFIVLVTSDNDPHIIEALYEGATSFINIAKGPVNFVKHIEMIAEDEEDVSSEILRHFLASKNVSQIKSSNEAYNLTKKELEILAMMRDGKHLKLIAQTTDTTYETVRTHVKRIYKKLGVMSASEAVIKAMTMNLN